MTMDRKDLGGLGPSLARGMTQRRLSRRSMLKLGGASVGALSLSQILAACSNDSGGGSSAAAAPSVDFDPASAEDTVNFSNWPVYIDKSKGTIPSLDAFTGE